MKKFTQSLCAALALLLLACALPFGAMAESRIVYVTDNTAPVYSLPHRLSNLMGAVPYGSSMRALAVQGDWVRVQNARGDTGYCAKSALSAKNPNTLNMYGWVREGGCEVYDKPGASYARIASLSAGARLNAVGVTEDRAWVRVQNGKRFGYVRAADLSRAPVSPDGAKPVWVVSNSGVNVSRAKNGKSADLGVISQGQRYLLLRVEGERAYIRNDRGQQGWVPKGALSAKDPNTLERTAYAQLSGKLLYPSTRLAGAKASVDRGEALTVVSVTDDGNWCRVRRSGKYYYMPTLLLDDEKAPAAGRVIERSARAPLFSESNLLGAPIMNLERGDKARLLGVRGGALRVETEDGIVGYCEFRGWRAFAA